MNKRVEVLRYRRSDFTHTEWAFLYRRYITDFAALNGRDIIPPIMVQALSAGDILTETSCMALFIYIAPGRREEEIQDIFGVVEELPAPAAEKQQVAEKVLLFVLAQPEQQELARDAIKNNWRTHCVAPGSAL